jgi:Na+-translocating ferredoxin:NAD+ oxidoreductase subunit G
MKNFLRLTLTLFVVCGAAAGALAFVNQITKPKIIEQAKVENASAMKEVSPGADEFKEVVQNRVFDALTGGEKTGSVVFTKAQGYSGNIHIAFGVGLDGSLVGIKILSQTETPGLGAKVAGRHFLDQFVGKAADAVVLKKDDPDGGSIDAVSAATISSRVVTNAVRAALDSFKKGELQ